MASKIKKIAVGLFLFQLTLFANAQITSDFSTTADGWTAPNASPLPIGSGVVNYNASGGNPGGYVSATSVNLPSGAPLYFYFAVPPKFLGNISSLYNHTITFDLQQGAAQTLSSTADVILSNGTTTLYYFSLPSQPATAPGWKSFSVTVNELSRNWKTSNSVTGTAATKDQIKTVLLSLTSFQIRGRFGATITTGSLDNVVMNTTPLPTPPTITSFTPLSGLPGTTVTINGNNFNTTLAQNEVYFNGVKGTVVTASPTKLTVTSPPKIAYGPITVTNLANGTQGTSTLNFNPLFDNNKDFGARVIPSTFASKVDFGTSTTEVGLSVGDLDGDGLSDVLTSGNSLNASVFRNTGQTGSVSATSFAAPLILTMPTGLIFGAPPGPAGRVGQNTIADMDGDGKLDLVINVGYNQAGNFDNSFAIFLNQSTPGNLSFTSGSVFQYGTPQNNNEGIAVADMDGDGRPELLFALQNSACQLGIAQNLSSPGNLDFAQVQNFSQGATFNQSISFGDLTGDGKPEIIIEAYLGGSISVYQNTSTLGTIALGVPFVISNAFTINIEVADMDNDGKNDLIFKEYGASPVHIKKNNYISGALSAASFSADILLASLYGTGGNFNEYSAIADVNGDNKPDIVTNDGNNVLVYQNNYSSGVLLATSFFQGIAFPGAVTDNSNAYVFCADVDGDNKPEILLRPGTANFRVYHNETFPPPNFSLFSPTSGPWATNVSLTGNSFSTGIGPPQNVGRLGLTITAIAPSSNTSATSVVPPGSISDRFSMTEHGLTGFSKPFNVTFSTNRIINSSSFLAGVDFTLTNNGSLGLAVADFDNDGKPDIVVDDNQTGRIFRNTLAAAGSVINATTFTNVGTTLATSLRLTSGDFDGDGKIDIVTGNYLYQNNSTTQPSFGPPVATNVTTASVILSNHDFNLDGKPDLASLNGSQFFVYENLTRNGPFTQNGTFASFSGSGVPATLFSLSGNSTSVAANDFDGDGYDDIAIGLVSTTSTLSVYLNNGLNLPITTAQFAAPVNFTANGSPTQIATADFDGDGKIDAALGYGAATLSIFKNQSTPGTISFAAKQDISAVAGVTAMAAQDLDGDGLPEIITTNFTVVGSIGSFSVFKNTSSLGSISFAVPITFSLAAGRNPSNIAVADVNFDRLPDLIIHGTGTTTNFLTVFQNNITLVVLTVSTQPSPVYSVCAGAAPTISAAATGTTNITYQWQFSPDGTAPFVDLANTGVYSNVSTPSFTINTSGNFGTGVYRCKINGDFATTVYTNTVSFTANTLPAAPTASNISNCGPGSVTLTASGGTNGNYLWYDVNGLIAGQSNSTYTTPVISITSSYSVAITNGTCVSSTTSLMATINPVPAAPSSSNVSNCGPGSVTLTASGGTNGNYLWYDVNGLIAGQSNSTYTTPVISITSSYSVAITNGACVSTKTNITATISALPAAPTAQGATACVGSSATFTASGGTNGQYAWYTVATGGTAIPGQTGSSYTTPALTITTTYFVSINNGTCESARVPVTATVTSSCNPPVITTTPLTTQIGGLITLPLVPLITTANNNLDINSIVVTVQPSSGASASVASGVLTINYNGINFSGTEQLTIRACDLNGNCSTQVFAIEVAGDITVYNGISPNGINPAFIIEYINVLPDTKINTVTVFDRWENQVWQGKNYDNSSVVFKGVSDGGSDLPTGVYFYKIDFAGGRKKQTGFISLRR